MRSDVHTLSGAYALDALDREDAALFEAHLEACPSCRAEVRELQSAAARMGSSEAAPPPPHLKARVVAAAERVPQLPPVLASPTGTDPRRGRRWFPQLMAVAAAAVVLAAGGLAYSQLQEPAEPGGTMAAGVVRVFEAPDARSATMRTTNGGTVSVATSPSLNRMAVDTDGLPELAAGEVYQLWAIVDGSTASAGLLEDPDAGAAMEMPAAGTEVAITIEPATGSEQPTDEPIMRVVPAEV